MYDDPTTIAMFGGLAVAIVAYSIYLIRSH